MEYTGEEIDKQIREIIEEGEKYSNKTLEKYLKALKYQANKHTEKTISIEVFLEWLKVAFFQDFSVLSPSESIKYQDYIWFEETISRQILDLDAMTNNGQISDPNAFFGISSPSGQSWYNFSIGGFLEGASRGFFIDSGNFGHYKWANNFSTGPLISFLTWQQFSDFLMYGQLYE